MRCSMVLCVVATAPAWATVLTFDSMGLPQYGQVTSYGSNMVGPCTSTLAAAQAGCAEMGNGWTPNIAVTYRTINRLGNGVTLAASTGFWDTGNGDLVNVTYPEVEISFAEVTLTPQPGWWIRVNSFDLGGWPFTDEPNEHVRVFNADYSASLFSYDGVIRGAGPTHDSFGPLNIFSTSAIHVQWGPSWNDGLDNVNFDQLAPLDTPEPASIFLFGGASVLFASRLLKPMPRASGYGFRTFRCIRPVTSADVNAVAS